MVPGVEPVWFIMANPGPMKPVGNAEPPRLSEVRNAAASSPFTNTRTSARRWVPAVCPVEAEPTTFTSAIGSNTNPSFTKSAAAIAAPRTVVVSVVRLVGYTVVWPESWYRNDQSVPTEPFRWNPIAFIALASVSSVVVIGHAAVGSPEVRNPSNRPMKASFLVAVIVESATRASNHSRRLRAFVDVVTSRNAPAPLPNATPSLSPSEAIVMTPPSFAPSMTVPPWYT
jgi:hypothetical protein